MQQTERRNYNNNSAPVGTLRSQLPHGGIATLSRNHKVSVSTIKRIIDNKTSTLSERNINILRQARHMADNYQIAKNRMQLEKELLLSGEAHHET